MTRTMHKRLHSLLIQFFHLGPCLPLEVQILLQKLLGGNGFLFFFFLVQPSLLSLVNFISVGLSERILCPHSIPWGSSHQIQFIWPAIWPDLSWAHCLHSSISAKPKFFHFYKLFQRSGTVCFPTLSPCQNLLPSETVS